MKEVLWLNDKMARNPGRRKEALKLYKQGMSLPKIAAKMEVSLRTVQRWLKDETLVQVRVVDMKVDEKPPLKTSKNVASNVAAKVVSSESEFDISLSRRVAIRLLNLSELAIETVEACLTDPDARRSDKLKAAQLAGHWLGIGVGSYPSGKFVSIPERVENTFAVQLSPVTPQLPLRKPTPLLIETVEDDEDDEDVVDDIDKAQAIADFLSDLEKYRKP